MNHNPIIIYFTLTKACNLSCLHCVRTHTPHNVYGEGSQIMSADKALDVMEALGKYYPNATLAITGGEPTLHPRFDEIAFNATSHFKNIVLTSNGIFSDEVKDKLVSLTCFPNFFIQISLDGDEKTHEIIRGKGTYKKTIKRIVQLSNECRSGSVSISTTVSKLNQQSMFDLAKDLIGIPFHKWRIAPEQIFNKEDLTRLISTSEWNQFVDDILKICQFKVSIKKIYDFKLMDKALAAYSSGTNRSMRLNCGFGKYKMYIYPDFSVLPCTCISHFSIANLLGNSVEETDRRLNACTPTCNEKSECAKCKYLPVCNGGCVGYSYHYNGIMGFGDIRCPKINAKKNYDF